MRTYNPDVPAVFTFLTYGLTAFIAAGLLFMPTPWVVNIIGELSLLAIIWPEIKGYRAYCAQQQALADRAKQLADQDQEKP